MNEQSVTAGCETPKQAKLRMLNENQAQLLLLSGHKSKMKKMLSRGGDQTTISFSHPTFTFPEPSFEPSFMSTQSFIRMYMLDLDDKIATHTEIIEQLLS